MVPGMEPGFVHKKFPTHCSISPVPWFGFLRQKSMKVDGGPRKATGIGWILVWERISDRELDESKCRGRSKRCLFTGGEENSSNKDLLIFLTT